MANFHHNFPLNLPPCREQEVSWILLPFHFLPTWSLASHRTSWKRTKMHPKPDFKKLSNSGIPVYSLQPYQQDIYCWTQCKLYLHWELPSIVSDVLIGKQGYCSLAVLASGGTCWYPDYLKGKDRPTELQTTLTLGSLLCLTVPLDYQFRKEREMVSSRWKFKAPSLSISPKIYFERTRFISDYIRSQGRLSP